MFVELQQNLSNYMKAVRLSRKKSITEFSEELGISRSELQNILKGTCNPRLDTISYIADKLNAHPSTLLLPPFSEPQQEFALSLLKTLDIFSDIPPEKQREAAELLCRLIMLLVEKE